MSPSAPVPMSAARARAANSERCHSPDSPRRCCVNGPASAAEDRKTRCSPTRTGRRLSRDAIERRLATHTAAAARKCPTLHGKHVTPHVLRHSAAMSLLHVGVDTSVIALWLGHADVRATSVYLHADMTIKERALALTTPATVRPGRYHPPDTLL